MIDDNDDKNSEESSESENENDKESCDGTNELVTIFNQSVLSVWSSQACVRFVTVVINVYSRVDTDL